MAAVEFDDDVWLLTDVVWLVDLADTTWAVGGSADLLFKEVLAICDFVAFFAVFVGFVLRVAVVVGGHYNDMNSSVNIVVKICHFLGEKEEACSFYLTLPLSDSTSVKSRKRRLRFSSYLFLREMFSLELRRRSWTYS